MTTYSYEGSKRYWQPRTERKLRNVQELSDSEEERSEGKWDVKRVMRLLRYYGAHRCLWDVTNPDNRNRKERRAALLDIVAVMNENLTLNQVVRKINVLRATYRYEKRRIKQRMRNGLGAKTKLKWFALADAFLRHVPRADRKRKSQLEDSDSDLDDSIVFKIEPENMLPLNVAATSEPVAEINLKFVQTLAQYVENLNMINSSKLTEISEQLGLSVFLIAKNIQKLRCLYKAEKLRKSLQPDYQIKYDWWFLAEKLMPTSVATKTNEASSYLANFVDINEFSMSTKPKNMESQKIIDEEEHNLLEGKWSLKYNVKFLRLYGSHRCLWDLKDPDYRSREMRLAAIEDIACAMGHGLDAEFVAKKIKIFRITYMQHRKRLLAAQKQNKESKVQLLWFPLADCFLRPHIGLRSIGANEPELPQFSFEDVITNLNLIDPALLTEFQGKGTQNLIEIGASN